MAEGARSPHDLIGSDRVEGTVVYNAHGHEVGTIKRVMIEKRSGQVVYAVMSFGGFLGLGEGRHVIPWDKLVYDVKLGGYRTDITAAELSGSPSLIGDDESWLGEAEEEELRAHFRIPRHGRSI